MVIIPFTMSNKDKEKFHTIFYHNIDFNIYFSIFHCIFANNFRSLRSHFCQHEIDIHFLHSIWKGKNTSIFSRNHIKIHIFPFLFLDVQMLCVRDFTYDESQYFDLLFIFTLFEKLRFICFSWKLHFRLIEESNKGKIAIVLREKCKKSRLSGMKWYI